MSFILLGILNSQIDAAGGGSYDLLETEILTSSATSVTFTGLGSYSDYKHLQVRAAVRTTGGADQELVQIKFNSDTTGYLSHRLLGNGSTVSSLANSSDLAMCGIVAGGGADTDNFGAIVADILDFSSSTKNTTVRSIGGVADSGGSRIGLHSIGYFETSAITAIDISFGAVSAVTGSRFSLYGVKA